MILVAGTIDDVRLGFLIGDGVFDGAAHITADTGQVIFEEAALDDGAADAVISTVIIDAATADIRHITIKLAVPDFRAGFAGYALIHDTGAVSCFILFEKASFDRGAANAAGAVIEDAGAVEIGDVADEPAV